MKIDKQQIALQNQEQLLSDCSLDDPSMSWPTSREKSLSNSCQIHCPQIRQAQVKIVQTQETMTRTLKMTLEALSSCKTSPNPARPQLVGHKAQPAQMALQTTSTL